MFFPVNAGSAACQHFDPQSSTSVVQLCGSSTCDCAALANLGSCSEPCSLASCHALMCAGVAPDRVNSNLTSRMAETWSKSAKGFWHRILTWAELLCNALACWFCNPISCNNFKTACSFRNSSPPLSRLMRHQLKSSCDNTYGTPLQ